jgi:hypothetical protein
MKIWKEGDTGEAICDTCERRVATTYAYRSVHLRQTGANVENVLVGVCDECDEVASIPAQSVPRLKEAREGKLQTVNARIPRHLDDVLHLLADRYRAATPSFSAAMLRYYLNEIATSESFARRVSRLADKDIVRGKADSRISLRLSERLWTLAWRKAREAGIERQTDMLKGLIIAALEDSVGGRAPTRRRVLEGIAAVA